ncbi:MAG: hypothetical protein K8R21_06165, partial [Leptospira sp.]|nr:hypothetical protein [Leptospira sp.]
MFEKKILITGTVTGLLLFGLTLYMTVSTPNVPIRSNHSGFTSTIIALELAQTKEQIKDIVGGPEDENHYEYLNRFKFSLKLDFLYIFLYIFYFLLLFEVCARENRYEIPLR